MGAGVEVGGRMIGGGWGWSMSVIIASPVLERSRCRSVSGCTCGSRGGCDGFDVSDNSTGCLERSL